MLKFPRFVSIPVTAALLISTGNVTIAVTSAGLETMPSAAADARHVYRGPGAYGSVQLIRNEMSSTEVGDVIAYYQGKSGSS